MLGGETGILLCVRTKGWEKEKLSKILAYELKRNTQHEKGRGMCVCVCPGTFSRRESNHSTGPRHGPGHSFTSSFGDSENVIRCKPKFLVSCVMMVFTVDGREGGA